MFFFGNGIDRKTLYIILGVCLLISLVGTSTESLIELLLTLPAVVIAITFHEFAHAFAADRFGDTTPKAQGRLTLNPISHIDPFGFILLLVAGVGWGRPVEINPNNFTSNKSRGICEMWVSLAGPLMNFLLAIIFTFIYYALWRFAPATQLVAICITLAQYTIIINIGLGIFNLIPLPPLDGEKIFRQFLPYNALQWLDANSYMLQIIFMILWITGLLGRLVSPITSFIFRLLLNGVGMIFGLL